MTNLPALQLLPLDTEASLPSNFIQNEQHTVTEANFRDYYFIVPEFAPFYIKDFTLTLYMSDGSQRPAVEGEDFTYVLPFVSGTRETGYSMYGAISLNQKITNGIIAIGYRSLGGDFVTNANTILEILAEKVYNPRTTLWDTVTNKPLIFPPTQHHQPADTVFGMQVLVDKISELSTVIANSPKEFPKPPTESTFYCVLLDRSNVVSGSSINGLIYSDLTDTAETLYWTIIHRTTSVSNFNATNGQVTLVADGTGFKADFSITCQLFENNPLTFFVALRRGNAYGEIIAISNAVTIVKSASTVSKSGAWTAGNPEGLGLIFENDIVTGLQNKQAGFLSLFANDKSKVEIDGITNETILRFGPNNSFKFVLSADGHLKMLDASNVLIWSDNTSVTSSQLQQVITNVTANPPSNLNTLEKLAAAINNDPNFYNSIVSVVESKQSGLSFTPVQQGKGPGQLTNTLSLGWSGSNILVSVDGANLGNLILNSDLSTVIASLLSKSGGSLTGAVYGKSGAITPNNTNNVGFAFGESTDTGLFSPATGVVQLAASGVVILETSLAGGAVFKKGVQAPKGQPTHANGSNANVTTGYSFLGDGDSGLFHENNSEIVLRIDNQDAIRANATDITAKLPVTLPEQLITSNDNTAASTKFVHSLLNTKQDNLGFVPVQQGTGIGQLTNSVMIGWSGISRLKATVDNTDLGNFVFDNHLSTAINTALANVDSRINTAISGITKFLNIDGSFAMTGQLKTASLNSNVNQNNTTSSLLINNESGTGDNAVAAISFLCNSQYGIKMYLRSDGYFGVGGWSRQAWSWYTTPEGNMVAAGDVVAYSDGRLKNNINVIKNALDYILRLRGVSFTWNNLSSHIENKAGKNDFGFIAQEVEDIIPEAVTDLMVDNETNETYKGVAYDKIIPFLTEAIKELHYENINLKEKLLDQDVRFSKLESQLVDLAARFGD